MSQDSARSLSARPIAESWRAPFLFAAKVVAGVGLGAWALTLGPTEGFVRGLEAGTSPALRPHVRALLAPWWAAFASAALVALALSSAVALRRHPPAVRARSAWLCAAAGGLVAIAVYVYLGYGLPMATRQAVFGSARAAGVSPGYPPYLLTNSELSSVQTFFRRQGGDLPNLSLTWQLRAWSALAVLAWGLLAAAAVARVARGRLRRWGAALGPGIVVWWLIGTGLAVGPAALARPTAVPQTAAWVLLAVLVVVAVVSLKRALRALDDEEYAHVLLDIGADVPR